VGNGIRKGLALKKGEYLGKKEGGGKVRLNLKEGGRMQGQLNLQTGGF